MKKICFVCMRKGSKGVKNKNFKKINGIPLYKYTLLQALNSKIFDKVVISTDSEIIYNRYRKKKKSNIHCFFLRPKYLSNNLSGKLSVIQHALKKSELYFACKFDVIFDLDVTSPLRKIDDIKKSYSKFLKEGSNNLFSVCLAKKNPYFNMVEIKNNRLKKVKILKKEVYSRQEAPKVYEMNASIYIWKRNFLLNSNSIFDKFTSYYEMPQSRSVDIDSNSDFLYAQFLLKNKKNI